MSAPSDEGGGTGQDLTRAWAVLAHVVTPTTFIAAILMYFGAVRANTMYGQLGLDHSLLGLSFQDYVLRSVTLTVEPLIVLLVLALIAPLAHRWVIRCADRHCTAVKRVIAVLAVLGLAGVVVGLAAMNGRLRLPSYAVPISLGLGVFVLVYGLSLYQRVSERRVVSTGDQVLQRVLCVVLLLVLLLWTVSELAQQAGMKAAAAYRSDPGALPSTVVYSARRLHLESPGIEETALPDPGAMYRYRYRGLHLLLHSNQRYFLLPACWASDPWARAIVLPADASLRLEFPMLKLPPECPA
ncbi:hypothetical protein GCM10009850_079710 [Nonomuraea monospora]|uniref:Uncharacterized protein n=1 Tax=Nonomuraea monospora TaxID=568818 RepID=A0ABN3CT55_9ACTN